MLYTNCTRPLVQWETVPRQKNRSSTHVLCSQLKCNFKYRGLGKKARYEGIGLATGYLPRHRAGSNNRHMHAAGNDASNDGEDANSVPLFDYNCTAPPRDDWRHDGDITLAPAGWAPPASQGGPCVQVGTNASLTVYKARAGPSSADLVPLEVYYSHTASDHYIVASDAGKADATALGYTHVQTLGYVWPPPGSANATSRYGLPSISKDDDSYIDQDYWRGRTWPPMIQLTYWALDMYPTNAAARGAAAGLVTQSNALLMKEWRGYGGKNSYAGSGRYVYENFGADTGEGYGYSSEAQPMYRCAYSMHHA
jgi:hypothetical protein